jgi:AIPR protein
MSKAEHDLVEGEIAVYQTGSRTASAALIAWFLTNVFRMEPEDVDDAICDGGGDKGIDALVVDEDLREITVLQSKHRDKPDAEQGDKDLRDFMGAARYFESPEAVDGLLRSKPNPELTQLINRLKIRDRVAEGAHATRMVFVSNGSLDAAGHGYVEAIAGDDPPLDVWDISRLVPIADRTRRPDLLPDQVELTSTTKPEIVDLGGGVSLAIGLIPASELVTLNGIEDLSLFDRNVRLGVGRTRINKELSETLSQPAEHRFFPAYHNGLTLLTNALEIRGDRLHLDGITVVNGCQSVLALFRNRTAITPELRVPVKVVQLGPASELTDKITYRTNNQNPVDIRDQRSTDAIQRDLQAQVDERYGGALGYSIRAGEAFTKTVSVLDNREAAQLLMAIYLGEPWNAVRKVRLFDEDYRRIFNREVDAHRLYLLWLISGVLAAVRDKLRPELQASFASVRLTLAYVLGQLLRESERGQTLLANPERWLPDLRDAVSASLIAQAESVADLVNSYVKLQSEERGPEFDPKVMFKNEAEIKGVERDVLAFSKRLVHKDPSYRFDVAPIR